MRRLPDRRDGGQVKGRAMMPDEPTTLDAPTAERVISRRTLIACATMTDLALPA